MSLKQQIQEDFKQAFKGKKEQEASTLKLLLANIFAKEKDNKFKTGKEELEDSEVLVVVSKESKKLKDTLDEAKVAGREEIANKAQQEIEILERYLPEQMSEDKITEIVVETIKEVGAETIKDMGKVLKTLIPKLNGAADNSVVSKIVKEKLND